MNKLVMSLATIILASCSEGNTLKIWSGFPVSEETDAAQLAYQIKANPSDWKAAADFLSREDLEKLPPGRYELTRSGVYANIQEYITKDSSNYEAHTKYVDVQVIQRGCEHIFLSSREKLSGCLEQYDPERDIEFWAASSDTRCVTADARHWVILFPSDAHMPCMTIDVPSFIRKVVIKVPVK